MKDKLSSYDKAIVKYVRRVSMEPSQVMLSVYNAGAKEVIQGVDLKMALHLAVTLSERYRAVGLPIWTSRELEMLVYDLSLKGYSVSEIVKVCVVASHTDTISKKGNDAFEYISNLVMKLAKKHGDAVFTIKDNVHFTNTALTKPHPNSLDKQFSDN